MAVNAGNLDSWFPITTTFRPGIGGASDANGFVILGRNGAGDIITTQCARLFDWRDSNFKHEAESMRFFYADPARDRGPDECCIVNAPEAAEISGRIAYLGGCGSTPTIAATSAPRLSPASAEPTRWLTGVSTG